MACQAAPSTLDSRPSSNLAAAEVAGVREQEHALVDAALVKIAAAKGNAGLLVHVAQVAEDVQKNWGAYTFDLCALLSALHLLAKGVKANATSAVLTSGFLGDCLHVASELRRPGSNLKPEIRNLEISSLPVSTLPPVPSTETNPQPHS